MKRKLNVRLLRKIQKHITEEPRRFFMTWYKAHGTPGQQFDADWSDLAKSVPDCGTAACIAGWANGLTGAKYYDWDDAWRASKQLGLSIDSDYLFINYMWPKPFCARYAVAKTPKQRAKIACQRIDYLIETGL